MKKWLIAVVIIAAILGLAVAVVFLGDNRIDSVIPPCTFVAKVVEVHEKQLFVTVTNSGWSSLTEGTPAYVTIPSNDSQTFAVGDYVIVDFDSMVQEIYPPIVPNVYTITKCDSDGNLLK